MHPLDPEIYDAHLRRNLWPERTFSSPQDHIHRNAPAHKTSSKVEHHPLYAATKKTVKKEGYLHLLPRARSFTRSRK
jgi:hypothetical protein